MGSAQKSSDRYAMKPSFVIACCYFSARPPFFHRASSQLPPLLPSLPPSPPFPYLRVNGGDDLRGLRVQQQDLHALDARHNTVHVISERRMGREGGSVSGRGGREGGSEGGRTEWQQSRPGWSEVVVDGHVAPWLLLLLLKLLLPGL